MTHPDRWQPVPVPLGDGRHDVGDAVRAAIAQRLIEDFGRLPDLTPQQVHHLALFGAASVRALLHELGTLGDMSNLAAAPVPCAASPADSEVLRSLLADINEWLGNSNGLMIEDVVEWRDKLATGLGSEPADSHQPDVLPVAVSLGLPEALAAFIDVYDVVFDEDDVVMLQAVLARLRGEATVRVEE